MPKITRCGFALGMTAAVGFFVCVGGEKGNAGESPDIYYITCKGGGKCLEAYGDANKNVEKVRASR